MKKEKKTRGVRRKCVGDVQIYISMTPELSQKLSEAAVRIGETRATTLRLAVRFGLGVLDEKLGVKEGEKK